MRFLNTFKAHAERSRAAGRDGPGVAVRVSFQPQAPGESDHTRLPRRPKPVPEHRPAQR